MPCILEPELTKMKSTDCVNFDRRVLDVIREHYAAKWYHPLDDWWYYTDKDKDQQVCDYLDGLGKDNLQIPRWVFEAIWEEYAEIGIFSEKEDEMVFSFLIELGWILFDHYYGADPISRDECTAAAVKEIKWEYTYEYFLSKKYDQLHLDAVSQVIRQHYGDDCFSIGGAKDGATCLEKSRRRWNKWKVYRVEDGVERDIKTHLYAYEACSDLFFRIASRFGYNEKYEEAANQYFGICRKLEQEAEHEVDALRAQLAAEDSICESDIIETQIKN